MGYLHRTIDDDLDDLLPSLSVVALDGLKGVGKTPARARTIQLDSYLARIVERDVEEAGVKVNRPGFMKRWLAAYGAATSTITDYARLVEAASPGESERPSKQLSATYRDTLERLFIVDPIPGWTTSDVALTRLRQGPKHSLADPALAARLQRLDAAGLALSTQRGPLIENLAALCVRVAASRHDAGVYHLRTRNGDHEIDLIVQSPTGHVVALEVKAADAVTDADTVHLHWLKQRLGDQLRAMVVLYCGRRAYLRKDGVSVVPIAALVP